MAFPTKNSVLDDFLSVPKAPPPQKPKILFFIVVSPSLRKTLVSKRACDSRESPQQLRFAFLTTPPPPRSAIRKNKGFRSGTLKRSARIRRRPDSRESVHLSRFELRTLLGGFVLQRSRPNPLSWRDSTPYEQRWKFITKIHAILAFLGGGQTCNN